MRCAWLPFDMSLELRYYCDYRRELCECIGSYAINTLCHYTAPTSMECILYCISQEKQNQSHFLLQMRYKMFLVNNQLEALFQYIYLFPFSTCFEQPSVHHQENRIVSIHHLVYVGDCLVSRSGGNGIPGSHLHRVTYTRCIDTVDSPDDEHWVARIM
jgi:hypothetical protein